MPDGEQTGIHLGTGQPIRLRWTNDTLQAVQPIPPEQAGDLWLGPALFDPQINGFAGIDFQRDDLTAADLRQAVRGLRRAGCTRFLLTLITAPWDRLLARLAKLRQLRQDDPELAAAIVGWHLEGPFLSDQPGFHGAHDPRAMEDPTPRHLAALRELARDDRVLLTLAPERKGAIPTIQAARDHGWVVSLGHTDASAEEIAAAQAAGATGFTHLGNACPQKLDRHDNILWRVLDTDGLRVSLIPDGIHVAPPLFRLIHRLLPPGRLLHTTDAMAAAGAPPGRYPLGPLELEVGEDRVVRQPGRTNFAGSALTPMEGVFRSARLLRRSWRQTWLASSSAPAEWMGVPVSLTPGNRADFCVLRVDANGELTERRVVASGQEFE